MILRRLVHKCALHLLSLSEREEERKAPSESKQAFDQRGHVLMSDRRAKAEPITAGTIQLLGLEDIKREFGSSWASISGHAMGIAENVIRSHLTDADMYTRQGDDAFVLFFALKTVAEGAHSAQVMSREIKAELSREMPHVAGTICVDHFVAEFANDIAFEDDCERPLADLLFDSLSEIRAEAEQALTKRRAALLRSARVVFRPVWSPGKRAILMFRCMLDAASGVFALEHLAVISEPNQLQSAMAELDLLVFGNAVKSLHHLLLREAKAILLIPVHFYTFFNKSSGDEYLRFCQSIPEPYRKFIFFELHGTPVGTPASRIEQICSALNPFSHGVIFQVSGSDREFARLITESIKGVALDLSDGNADFLSMVKRTVALARSKGLMSFLHGANSISQLQAAIGAECDYINGEAVHVSLDEPKGAVKFMPPGLLDDMHHAGSGS